jgi:hypothetical protein
LADKYATSRELAEIYRRERAFARADEEERARRSKRARLPVTYARESLRSKGTDPLTPYDPAYDLEK